MAINLSKVMTNDIELQTVSITIHEGEAFLTYDAQKYQIIEDQLIVFDDGTSIDTDQLRDANRLVINDGLITIAKSSTNAFTFNPAGELDSLFDVLLAHDLIIEPDRSKIIDLRNIFDDLRHEKVFDTSDIVIINEHYGMMSKIDSSNTNSHAILSF